MVITYRCVKIAIIPTFQLLDSSWRLLLLKDVSHADDRDLAWLLERIGIVKLGIFQDSSHGTATEKPFRVGVVYL